MATAGSPRTSRSSWAHHSSSAWSRTPNHSSHTTFVVIRAFRGHFSSTSHRGVEIPGIYWHFVDVMWIIVYTTVYII